MSKCYKCDRCGMAYTENKTQHTLTYGLLRSQGSITGVDLVARGEGVRCSIDLCDKCIDELWVDFFKFPPTGKLMADK